MKLCEIYDEGCSSLSFDYTCKIRDGTEFFLLLLFFIYAIMYILIQTYTSHNNSRNKIYKKKNEKECDGTELEMETQSDTRHNLKTTPTPTPTVSLHCEKLPPPCHLFITKKKKSLKADM